MLFGRRLYGCGGYVCMHVFVTSSVQWRIEECCRDTLFSVGHLLLSCF